MKLYEINEQIQQLINMSDEIDEQAFKDTMEILEFELEEKADNYAKVIKMYEGEIVTLKNETDRLNDMKKSRDNKIEYLKRSLEESMILADNKKFKTDLFSFNIQKNVPSLDISDNAVIPSEYYIEKEPQLDKRKLLDSVKNGLKIDGINIKQTESLRIR